MDYGIGQNNSQLKAAMNQIDGTKTDNYNEGLTDKEYFFHYLCILVFRNQLKIPDLLNVAHTAHSMQM